MALRWGRATPVARSLATTTKTRDLRRSLLRRCREPPSHERTWRSALHMTTDQIVFGFVAGVVGVPIIPLMPYLQGLDVKPSELAQTLGVVLCATSLTLTSSLLFFGLLDGPRAVVSAAAVVPALAGMWLGQQIRLRLSVEQFRLAVFWALLLTGLY